MSVENAKRLATALKLAFHDEQAYAPEALRAFLQEGRGWERVNPELPAGPHTWRELLEAVTAALFRFGLVDDVLFDRLVARAAAARSVLEEVRCELLHPERLPPTWLSIGPVGGSVERIEVDPCNYRRLLCCVHVHNDGRGAETRIRLFRSMDRGASWNEQEIEGTQNLLVRWITFDRHRPGHVLMGTDAGLWSSEDHGDTWTRDPASAPHLPVWQVRIHPFHEDAHLIATGEDWSEAGGVTAGASMGAGAVTPVSTAGKEVTARRTAERTPGWFQFFNKDEGVWTSIALDPPQRAASFAPRDWRRVWIAAGRRLVRPDDGCRTFRAMGDIGRRHVWDIAVDPDDSDRVLVGTDDGIYCSFRSWPDVRAILQCKECTTTGSRRRHVGCCHRTRTATLSRSWCDVATGGERFPDQRCWSLARASDGALYGGADGAGCTASMPDPTCGFPVASAS